MSWELWTLLVLFVIGVPIAYAMGITVGRERERDDIDRWKRHNLMGPH